MFLAGSIGLGLSLISEQVHHCGPLPRTGEDWPTLVPVGTERYGLLLFLQLKSVVRCTVCNYQSVRFDPFTFLSLPLPMESTVNLEAVGGYGHMTVI